MPMQPTPHQSDVRALRERARDHVESGAFTQGYAASRDSVLRLLNAALATEIVSSLRYRHHHYSAKGMASATIGAEFLKHARDEDGHAGRFAERIRQLGGTPDFSPQSLASRSYAEYIEASTLPEMIKENLVAERIAIHSYRESIRSLGASDPTTRRLFEEVLTTEEQHAEALLKLIRQLGTPPAA